MHRAAASAWVQGSGAADFQSYATGSSDLDLRMRIDLPESPVLSQSHSRRDLGAESEVAAEPTTLEVVQNAPSEFRLSRMHSPEAVRDPG
jgi:hypothetical protein